MVQPAVAQVRKGGGRDMGARCGTDEEAFALFLLAAKLRLRASACSEDGPTEVVRDQGAPPPAFEVAAGLLIPR